MKRGLARPDSYHRQRPISQARHEPSGHCVDVIDKIPLGGAGSIEQLLVEMSERHTLSLLRRLRSSLDYRW